MYMGVKNHHSLPRVASYADAQKALAVWTSKPRRGKQVAQVHELRRGSIAFRLYDTDVVVRAPDNTVHIDNYGTATTSGFARQFLPAGIWLHYPVERRGCSGGANTIGFSTGDSWRDTAVCQGDVVEFRQTESDLWEPDPETCYDLTLPAGVERKAVRELARRYHLAEFESWLAMAPMHLAGTGNPVNHAEWDLIECMDALEKRDFRQAAMHLPLIAEPTGFGNAARMKPLAIDCAWGHYVTMGSFAKLKLAMWHAEGVLDTETRKVWPRRSYDSRMKQLREMETLGISTCGMGPEI